MNIYQHIKKINPSLLLEIGSHFGIDTIKISEIVPDCDIISFEPDPRNIKVLESKIKSTKIKLEKKAVSDLDGHMDFHLSSGKCRGCTDDFLKENDWSASSSLKRPIVHLKQHPWVSFDKTIKVETIRLDSYEPISNKIIDFIWMDVQGAEDLVFRGAKKTLERTKFLYTEFSNVELYEQQLNLDKIVEFLGVDWEIIEVYPNDVLLKNKKYEI